MAAGVLKLAGQLLKNKGLMKGIRNEALVSGALNTGVNLATGADPLTGAMLIVARPDAKSYAETVLIM